MTAIKVENLSKSYMVGHNVDKSGTSDTFRETLSRNAKNLARKTRDMFTGQQIVQGDEVEEFWALKDINFEIQPGERVGIIGRNGAGKSTLLKILSRITEPTTGRVTINGRVASLLEVGTGFHPELTGRENIFLNGAILGMSRKEIQRKFDEIVDFAEVEKFLDTPVKRYSSGMYVRLAFAVAAHLEPEILVVDEVLAVGDAQFQKKCLGKMKEVSGEGRTVLFVSHNIASVKSLCGLGMLLDSGTMKATGPIDDVVSEYLATNTLSSPEVIIEADDKGISRSGSGRARITKIALIGSAGQKAAEIVQGKNFTVKVWYEGVIANANVAVIVRDEMGQIICSPNSFHSYSGILNLEGQSFECKFLSNTLMPGRYVLTPYLGAFDENVDTVNDCLCFDIIQSDIYGTGRPPDRRDGLVFFDHSWMFN